MKLTEEQIKKLKDERDEKYEILFFGIFIGIMFGWFLF